MPEDIRKVVDRLKEDIATIEGWQKCYWNKSLGTNHLKSMAVRLKNDVDTIAAYLKNF